MTTLTITPTEAHNLTIPATDELLRGWVGPVQADGEHGPLNGCIVGDEPFDVAWADYAVGPLGLVSKGRTLNRTDLIPFLRLPLSRPEVIDRLYRVFAAGARCGCGYDPGEDGHESGGPQGWISDPAPSCCRGTKWLRPPADLSRFRGVKAAGWGPELEAALLYLSWVRMAAGVEPIEEAYTLTRDGYRQAVAGDHERCPSVKRGVRQAVSDFEEGILAEGHALLDTTPEGPVIRAEVPNAVQ